MSALAFMAAVFAGFALLGWNIHRAITGPRSHHKRTVIWPCTDNSPECNRRFERHLQHFMKG